MCFHIKATKLENTELKEDDAVHHSSTFEEVLDEDLVLPLFDGEGNIQQKQIDQIVFNCVLEQSLDLGVDGRQPLCSHEGSPAQKQMRLSPTNQVLIGEKRLKVEFINLGTVGEHPQRFGKSGYIIPDGLIGRHHIYNQDWQFEARHGEIVEGKCSIIWSITNLTSGTRILHTETAEEASQRVNHGKTICTRVVRGALEARAAELEQKMESAKDNPVKLANLQDLVKALRPHNCVTGLLFFGLLHERVQIRVDTGSHIKPAMEERGDSNAKEYL